jgi:Spy/CpxP family protein refolding chaperone
MHPGFWGWLRQQHEQYHAAEGHGGHPGEAEACHPGRHRHGPGWGGRWAHFGHGGQHGGFDEHGGGFGVRRPLRFLAHKLELSDDQVASFAAILDRLKTERAQADVDQRRRTASLAEAFESASFDATKVDAANDEQAKSAERLRASIKLALEQMHALLEAEQRKKFAYFLRAGILAI